MRFAIRHELPRRIRFTLKTRPPAGPPARAVEAALRAVPGVGAARLAPGGGSLVARYDGAPATRRALLRALRRLPPRANGEGAPAPDPLEEPFRELVRSALGALAGRALGGAPRAALSLYGSLPFLWRGLRSLGARRVDSELLDAAAIGTALRMGDYGTASTISSLLRLGEYLRLRTELQAKRDLSRFLRDGEREVWLLVGGRERKVPARRLKAGDRVVVRTGHAIPVDGRIRAGQASVDQSSLTGESAPARKRPGSLVYDGTVVADGRLEIETLKAGADTRRAKIVALVQEAAALKAQAERRADRLADGLTPYIFSAAALTRLWTGDPARAASVLLVDYSCALKLSIPIAIKTCMIEALRHGIVLRGGKAVEALAEADTVVFDKTGTLTEARPRVVRILPMPGHDQLELLKATACVEEHFPHPVASAILRESARLGVRHTDEDHGEVKYVVSHGVVSSVRGRRFVVGSRRMMLEEGVALDGAPALTARGGLTAVYVGIGRRLAGVFTLDDPVRAEAGEALAGLRALGIGRIVLLTGDSRANAERIAALGFDAHHAEVSPEEKAAVVRRLKAEGRRVAMVGDGINDAPALAAADAGVSFQHGTDIARETADVLILKPDLRALCAAIRLSRLAMARVGRNFRGIVGVNSLLIAGAALGRSSPAGSALAHNLTTLFAALGSLRPYLPGAGAGR